MGGIEARIERHLRDDKKLFWHIDYILSEMVVVGVICAELLERYECRLAKHLSSSFENIESFGSSDCGCRSHLFYSPYYEQLHSEAFLAFVE